MWAAIGIAIFMVSALAYHISRGEIQKIETEVLLLLIVYSLFGVARKKLQFEKKHGK
ncbi:hypothetical protein [Chryseobacterium sp. LAM-KRS1]|uniref:hypothetical protein n=1 Tax=Chryseobacterium sp. LAM-KRS1 TaxID=2715754 RepID=UPI00397795D8